MMRRKDREITGITDKLAIINQCKVCRLGLSDQNKPYIVPLNYGYHFDDDALTLFFHGAKEGKKIEIIKNNKQACFEVDCGHELIEGKTACTSSYAFKSVIGFGEIEILEEPEKKKHGLRKIMQHQTGKDTVYDFTEEELDGVLVYQLNVQSFTGKQRNRPA